MRARECESTPGRIWSIISTTLTFTPHMSARATAASSPIKPPPTMTASVTLPSWQAARMAPAASRRVRERTFLRSLPSTGGMRGLAPVASTSLS